MSDTLSGPQPSTRKRLSTLRRSSLFSKLSRNITVALQKWRPKSGQQTLACLPLLPVLAWFPCLTQKIQAHAIDMGIWRWC